MTALDRVRQARAGLLLTHPFFGVLALKMNIRECEDIPTAGVTTSALLFNPAYIASLAPIALKGLIAHEVLHLALCHHARVGSRNPELWNIACDFAINLLLVDDGFKLPDGGLIGEKYRGMSAEQIYDKLLQSAKKINPQGWGEFESAGPEESATANEAARVWAENAAEAMRAAKSAGKMPAALAREIGEALAPRADWKSLLRRFMTDQVRVVPTWSRPNKRFPHTYLPGKLKAGMGELVIGVDTSGSIGPAQLAVFAAEISAIVADCEPSCVRVVYCDADVNSVETFEAGEEIALKPHGGGGTDFRPVFERIATEGWNPVAAIYLTDLCGTFPDAPPAYPVLWASYGAGDAKAPWGETVAIDALL